MLYQATDAYVELNLKCSYWEQCWKTSPGRRLSPPCCLPAVSLFLCNTPHVHYCKGRVTGLQRCLFPFPEKRCPTLSMPTNGGFKCLDGAYFGSRCEYYCSPGYQLKGDRIVTCMDSKAWSGRPAACVGECGVRSASREVCILRHLPLPNPAHINSKRPFFIQFMGRKSNCPS